MGNKKSVFTSESVSEGHPDKLADQISDAVLDACLCDDPQSRVACETFTTTGLVLVGGEVTTETYVDVPEVARNVVKEVGYTHPEYGIDYESMAVLTSLHSQSQDIACGVDVDKGLHRGQGAGDQGFMFGYACRETPQLMPAPILYAHQIIHRAALMRKSGEISWLRPDGKSQITLEYEGFTPKRVLAVVLSHQHDDKISHGEIEETLISSIIRPVLEPTGLLCSQTQFFINPTGRFVVGGPLGDTGLTGRKIVMDTYGGRAHHGGGAFSGKDPSKVDRSAAYMARCIAKNVVAANLCERCEVGLAYAIGVPDPLSVTVNCFETQHVPEEKIQEAVTEIFDPTPRGIIETLDLRRPIYQATTNYGHFGKEGLPWESLRWTEQLKQIG